MTFHVESKARDRIAFSIDSSQLISGLQVMGRESISHV